MHEFPILYKYTSKHAVQTWMIAVDDNTITTYHGQLGGKIQQNSEIINLGKNIGKANQTTPAQQAEAEAKSQWEKKKDRQSYKEHDDFYTTDIVEDPNGGNVMLAQSYNKHADKMPEVCQSQPKLDGIRCKAVTINGTCILYSRTNTIIKGVPHINRYLEKNFDNTILDGELYSIDYHDKFEELVSFIRQDDPKQGHEIVDYHVYDIIKCPEFDGTKTKFKDRLSYLEQIDQSSLRFTKPLALVNTRDVNTFEQIEDDFRNALKKGYEGLMLRNPDTVYENKRSYGLQKVKEMDDAEFKIVAIYEGKGKLVGHAMFTLELDDNSGRTFDCKLKGSFDNLKQIFQHKEDYIGKLLTTQFQGRTAYNMPRFPVGLRIRDSL